MKLEVGTEALLAESDSEWSGERVRIIDIAHLDGDTESSKAYLFEVLDKTLPPFDGGYEGKPEHAHMGATLFESDFLEV